MNEIIGLTPSPEVFAYAKAIVSHFREDFDHLEELQVVCFLDSEEIIVKRRKKAACVIIPNVTGQLSKVFSWSMFQLFGFEPEIVIICDAEAWSTSGGLRKTALIYHELAHVVQKENRNSGLPMFDKQTGRPVYELQDHDVEEFYDVAAKFGDALGGIERLHRAANFGEKVSINTIKQIEAEASRTMKALESTPLIELL